MRRLVTRLLPALLFAAGPADAAFECLPGPAPGGLGDWAWSERGRPGFHGSVALGRPAAVDGLLWSHVHAGWRGRRFDATGTVYSLALEEIYREMSAGLLLGFHSIHAGIRGWRVAWADGTSRTGWTCEGGARRARGRFSVRFDFQGLTGGGRDPAAPEARFALGADLRAGADLRVGASAIRSTERTGLLCRLAWSPLPRLTLSETIVFPGPTARSGIEIGTEVLSVGLWAEPSDRLGMRTGILCSAR